MQSQTDTRRVLNRARCNILVDDIFGAKPVRRFFVDRGELSLEGYGRSRRDALRAK